MSKVTAWETAEIRGPKLAYTVTIENMGRMLKRSKRLLIVVGGAALEAAAEGVNIPSVASRMAKILNGTIVSSPGIYKEFQRYSDVNVVNLNHEDAVNRLKDPGWKGFDGKGEYDFMVFLGGIYFFQSMMLSTLKHFAPKLRTVSLDRFYHPNASFSLENLSPEKWKEGLEAMLRVLESK